MLDSPSDETFEKIYRAQSKEGSSGFKIVNDEVYLEENTSAARSVVGENNNIFR
jgi:hypothetical protein